MEKFILVIVSVLTSMFVAHLTAKASSYSKDVLAERKAWRDTTRRLSVEVVTIVRSGDVKSDRLKEIFSEFRVRLNPDDSFDNAILDTIEACMVEPSPILEKKFLALVSRLLKHDWERAKSEASWNFFKRKPDEASIKLLRSSDYLI